MSTKKAEIPDWLGVKVPLKATSHQDVNASDNNGKEEEEKPMCDVCFQFYFNKHCHGCVQGWKEKARHPCQDYGVNLTCPECDTDPAIFWL